MKFINCISGTRVEDFSIVPMFNGRQLVYLSNVVKEIRTQKAMDYILMRQHFVLLDDGTFATIVDIDDLYTLAVMERYPEYEKEMIDYFGELWYEHYIRYGH